MAGEGNTFCVRGLAGEQLQQVRAIEHITNMLHVSSLSAGCNPSCVLEMHGGCRSRSALGAVLFCSNVLLADLISSCKRR